MNEEENLNLSAEISDYAHYTEQVFKESHLEMAQIDSSEFYDCTFNQCVFTEAVFRNCRFNNCTFVDCDLSLIQVPGCVFSATRFENSKLIGVNWTLADWSATRLSDPFSFLKCALSHTTFIGLNLKGIQIIDCQATEVDFREANLSKSNFSGTDLSKSLFLTTDLTGADLSRARNYHISPGENTLTQAKFSLPEALSLLHSLDIILEETD